MNPWQKKYPYPDRLYEMLPFIYGAAGLVTMLWLRNLLAVASGLVLIGAALLVGYWRSAYRRGFIQTRGHIDIPSIFRDEVGSPGLVELNWKEAFHCGHPVIDAQHRRLFGLCNILIDMLIHHARPSDIEMEISGLIEHISEHFWTEEGVLAATRHPLSLEHREQHVVLLARTKNLMQQYARSELVARDLVRHIAYDVIAGHILTEDIKWAALNRG
jgi:hemerythrin-like metal-binding protein